MYLAVKPVTKKLDDLDEDEVILFTNGLMSHIVSYNSTQSLRFKNHITFSEICSYILFLVGTNKSIY
jgi:hypothetical protein